jgi:hypothetical protein
MKLDLKEENSWLVGHFEYFINFGGFVLPTMKDLLACNDERPGAIMKKPCA